MPPSPWKKPPKAAAAPPPEASDAPPSPTAEQLAKLLKSSMREVSPTEAAELMSDDEEILDLDDELDLDESSELFAGTNLKKLLEHVKQTQEDKGGHDGGRLFSDFDSRKQFEDPAAVAEWLARQPDTKESSEIWFQATAAMTTGQLPRTAAEQDAATLGMARSILLDEKGVTCLSDREVSAVERCAKASLTRANQEQGGSDSPQSARALAVAAYTVLAFFQCFQQRDTVSAGKSFDAAIAAKHEWLRAKEGGKRSSPSAAVSDKDAPAGGGTSSKLHQCAKTQAAQHGDTLPLARLHILASGMLAQRNSFAAALQHLHAACACAHSPRVESSCWDLMGKCYYQQENFVAAKKFLARHVELDLPAVERSAVGARCRQHMCVTLYMLAAACAACCEGTSAVEAEVADKWFDRAESMKATVDKDEMIKVEMHRLLCMGKRAKLRDQKRGGAAGRSDHGSSSTYSVGDVVEVIPPATKYVGERGEVVRGPEDAPAGRVIVRFKHFSPAVFGAGNRISTGKTVNAGGAREISFQAAHLRRVFCKRDADAEAERFRKSAQRVKQNGRFCFGDEVIFEGLVKREDLNGRHAVVRRTLSEWRGRYEVELVSTHTKRNPENAMPTEIVHVLSKNLVRAPPRPEECGICLGEVKSPGVKLQACGHRFCAECLDDVLGCLAGGVEPSTSPSSNAECPLCRAEMTAADLSSAARVFAARRQVALCNACTTAIVPKSAEKLTPGLQRFRHLCRDADLTSALRAEVLRELPPEMAAQFLFPPEEEEPPRKSGARPVPAPEEANRAFSQDYERRRREQALQFVEEEFAEEVEEPHSSVGGAKQRKNANKRKKRAAAAAAAAAEQQEKREAQQDRSVRRLVHEKVHRDVVGDADDGSDDPVIRAACDVKLNKTDIYGDGDQSKLLIKPGTPGPDLEAYWSSGGNFDPFQKGRAGSGRYSPLLTAAAAGNATEVEAVLMEVRRAVRERTLAPAEEKAELAKVSACGHLSRQNLISYPHISEMLGISGVWDY